MKRRNFLTMLGALIGAAFVGKGAAKDGAASRRPPAPTNVKGGRVGDDWLITWDGQGVCTGPCCFPEKYQTTRIGDEWKGAALYVQAGDGYRPVAWQEVGSCEP